MWYLNSLELKNAKPFLASKWNDLAHWGSAAIVKWVDNEKVKTEIEIMQCLYGSVWKKNVGQFIASI